MLRWLLASLLTLVSLLANSESVVVLNEPSSVIGLLEGGGALYRADLDLSLLSAERSPAPQAPDSPADFVLGLQPVSQVDQITGGRYWLYAKLQNQTDQDLWVINPHNAVIDRVHVYVYNEQGVQDFSTGYLYPHERSLHYGVTLELPRGQPHEVLILIESRYFSGLPQFDIVPQALFHEDVRLENLIVIACFGAIVVLALYNLFLAVSIKEKSYFYYSAYLLCSVLAWCAAFNALGEWFEWHSYYLLLPPFFLTIAFNTLYYIHFLELRDNNPRLSGLSYGLAIGWIGMAFAFPLFSPGRYMMLYGISSSIWILMGLWCGVIRLRNGYKPARFFVAAFVVVFVGILLSILHLFGLQSAIKNNYIVTLVAQTIDMLLLSLALADRIRIFREEKEFALKQAYETERRAMEKEQEANKKLQQALVISEQESQRKSDFLRMVSHELRTPLHSIVSSVEQWNVDGGGDESAKGDLVNFIGYGAARLRTQVDNLVLLAETDDMKLEPNAYGFEIRPLLDKVCYNVSGLVHDNVEFIHRRDADAHTNRPLPMTFKGDAYLIEHLLRSVLENACKYTEQGKVEFYVGWNNEDQLLTVDIMDTGCGMTREQQKTMFNDFVQVSRGLDRRSEGLGLGLTICYRLSEILSADFVINSELGEGTHVHISLPLEVSDSKVELVNTEVQPAGHVLIVEDNLINAQVLEHIVIHLGYQVDVVYSGQEALRRLEEQVYSIILMDIQMPIMDGITATRWIRQRGVSTPIVAVTANSDSEVRRRCIDVGMNDVMVKPARRADIQRILERQLPRLQLS